MNNPLFVYEQYDKISDDLMILGINTVLKFTVSLTKYNDRYGRMYSHKEFEYTSRTSSSPVVTIKRSFDYYVSIENIKNVEDVPKEFILIGINDMYMIREHLSQVSLWFTDKKYSKLFAKKNGELILSADVDPIIISNLPMNKYLKFTPIIYNRLDNYQTGIRMYINSDTNYVDMPISRFMGFLYTINTLDMYNCAQNMLNYIQRPEPGFNLTSFASENGFRNEFDTESDKSANTYNKVTRTIPVKSNNTSFFNKIIDLERTE